LFLDTRWLQNGHTAPADNYAPRIIVVVFFNGKNQVGRYSRRALATTNNETPQDEVAVSYMRSWLALKRAVCFVCETSDATRTFKHARHGFVGPAGCLSA